MHPFTLALSILILMLGAADSGAGTQACCNTDPAAGCVDPAIEATVCAFDPYCCSTAWDGACVNEVTTVFGDNCDCSLVSTTAEGCYEPAAPPGDEMDISDCVCAGDSYCCDTAWDSLCVSEVASLGCNGAAICGNGIVDPLEECDDGNAVNGDGCSAECLSEAPVPVPAMDFWSRLAMVLILATSGFWMLQRARPR